MQLLPHHNIIPIIACYQIFPYITHLTYIYLHCLYKHRLSNLMGQDLTN